MDDLLNESTRSIEFTGRTENRFWWHNNFGSNYVPPVYSFLSNEEWTLLKDWFDDTDVKYGPCTGECSVPAISLLQGLVMGSNIQRIVQLGHFTGYSTLCWIQAISATDFPVWTSSGVNPPRTFLGIEFITHSIFRMFSSVS